MRTKAITIQIQMRTVKLLLLSSTLALINMSCTANSKYELLLKDYLFNEKHILGFKSGIGDRKLQAFSITDLKSAVATGEEINQSIASNIAPITAEVDMADDQNMDPIPITYSWQKQVHMYCKDKSPFYFMVDLNTLTGIPTSIHFVTQEGILIQYNYTENGVLEKYFYQESKAKQNGDYVSYDLLKKNEINFLNLNVKKATNYELEKLEQGRLLYDLVQALWLRYEKQYGFIDYKETFDKLALKQSIDTLFSGYKARIFSTPAGEEEQWRVVNQNKLLVHLQIVCDRESVYYEVKLIDGGSQLEVENKKVKQDLQAIFSKQIIVTTPVKNGIPVGVEKLLKFTLVNGELVL